jgi:hypothetical protein
MKYYFTLIVTLFLLVSCNDTNKKEARILSDSSGNLNNLSVVIDNDSWNSEIGETIRDIFAAPVDGLPQKEPLFNINQIPTSVFSDFATKNRIILKIEKSPTKALDFNNDTYAKPQKVVVVKGNSKTEIIEVLNENASKIITAFKDVELKERKRQISKSLSSDKAIRDSLGITIKFPSVYRIATAKNDFFWLRKDITTGTTNIMLYEIPLNSLTIDSTLVQQVIQIRDSIGKQYIPGPTEGTFMKTEEAYSPFFYTTILDGKPTFEMRATWDVKDAFMAGPFVTYLIRDDKNNRYLVAEGFAFAPSVNKRDYMFELEAIIKSIRFLQ